MEGKILILGRTQAGESFQPRNWCDRIACAASLFDIQSKKLSYHKCIHPVYLPGENGCAIMVDTILESENKELYNFVIDFAKSNDLVIIDGRQEQTKKAHEAAS